MTGDQTMLDARKIHEWIAGLPPVATALSAPDLAPLNGFIVDQGSLTSRDDDGRSGMWWASAKGYATIVQRLLDAGADPAVADREGITPLMNAGCYGYYPIAE